MIERVRLGEKPVESWLVSHASLIGRRVSRQEREALEIAGWVVCVSRYVPKRIGYTGNKLCRGVILKRCGRLLGLPNCLNLIDEVAP